MMIQSFAEIIAMAQSRPSIPISVAAAHDIEVLRSIQAAQQAGLIRPYLIGNQDVIEKMMIELQMDRKAMEIIPADSEEQAAYTAAKLAHEGIAACVMKGLLNSTTFLKAILHKDFSLRQNSLLSHVSIFEIPEFSKLLYVTDGGLNVQPDLEQKDAILRNAIAFLRRTGLDSPKVALLAANEKVMPGMPVTQEAEALATRAKNGGYGAAIVEGPVPLDLAISPEAAIHKNIDLKIGGAADLLVAPSIEVGNTLGKAITYFGHGTMAGIVLGAKVPLVLTSRADSARGKFVSLAFSVLEATQTIVAQEHLV